MDAESPMLAPGRWLTRPRFWLGVLITAMALYLTLRDVQWPQVGQALATANPALLLLAVLVFLLTNWAKGVRWRLMFYPFHHRLSVNRCVWILFIGQLANNLLPVRLGEFARAYLLGESHGIGKLYAFATTVVEKAMDSVMLLLLIAALSPLIPLPPWLRRSSLVVSGVLAALLVILIVAASQRGRIVTIIAGLIKRYPAMGPARVIGRLAEASAELKSLRDWGAQAQLWGWSILIWLLAVLTNELVLWAVHLQGNPLISPLLLVVLMTGAIMPTSPLQIGVFHYLCIITLGVFGIDQSHALTYALLLHMIVYLPILVGGVLGLWIENYDLGSLAASSRGERA